MLEESQSKYSSQIISIMNEIFPFDLFPYLQQYEASYFTYTPQAETFTDAIVRARLQYRPGAYVINDYSNGLGEYLYVGESGFKNGRLVAQQIPYRIFKATCILPNTYPECMNKREVKRADGWTHIFSQQRLPIDKDEYLH